MLGDDSTRVNRRVCSNTRRGVRPEGWAQMNRSQYGGSSLADQEMDHPEIAGMRSQL